MNIDWMQTIGGLGLFLLSLRLLTTILETSVVNSLRPLLKKSLSRSFVCFLMGFAITALVQASSITIIATMGLLSTSLITLQQGFFLMLGATLGTTVKSWFFVANFHQYGVLIIGFCSFILIFIKRPLLRKTMEAFLITGLLFLSLEMFSQGLKPLLEQNQAKNLFKAYSSIINIQLWALIIGAVLAMALQSSSAVVFLVLEFTTIGEISFPIGAALILGANIGTSIIPLLASLEYSRNVKRLAIAHVLIKFMGVFATLLFFPTFLLLVDSLIPGKAEEYLIAHLAMVHTLFNFINIIIWGLLSSLTIRFLFTIVPNHGYDHKAESVLSLKVRRMLARHPEHASKEISRQMSHLEDMIKSAVDYSLALLIEDKKNHKSVNSMLMMRRFDNFKEVIYDLLVRLKQNSLPKEKDILINSQLHLLGDYSNFYYLSLAFKEHVEKGILLDSVQVPSEVKNLFQEFQKGFNEIWLKIVLDNLSTEFGANLKNIIKDLENVYYLYLSKQEENSPELFWLYETIRFQRQMVVSFLMIYEETQEISHQ